MQALHTHFTHCDGAMQALHTHFTPCGGLLEPIYGGDFGEVDGDGDADLLNV